MLSDLCEEDSTFLEGITQLLQDRRRKINTTFEEDRNTLHDLQAQNEALRKENARLVKENSILREEISFLQLSSKEKDEKLRLTEARKEALKKEASFAETKWRKLIETMNKKCTCGRGKMDKAAHGFGTPDLSPSVKVKNVSNVFFMSPVKAKTYQQADVVLAPLSEDYLTEHVNASTPVIVSQTKKTRGVHFESNRSDSEDEIGSPSLFSDHESKYETPGASKKLRGKNGKETPGTEVSAVLFSDKSLADDHGNKTSDVSDELNVHFNRLSANVSTDGNDDLEVVEVKGRTCLENNKENVKEIECKSSHCFQEPDIPIVKKRKCAPSEENDSSDRKSPVLVQNRLKVESSHISRERSIQSCNSLHEKNDNSRKKSSASHEMSSSRRNPPSCSKTDTSLQQTWLAGKSSNIQTSSNIKYSKTKPVEADGNRTKSNPSTSSSTTTNYCRNQSTNQSTAKVSTSTSTTLETNPKNSHPTFKHHSVVRKKDERAKLPGFACEECRRYYESDNLSAERMAEVLKNCSRHKHVSAPPPSTPPQFWSLDFPPTQECIDKGYMLDENQQLPTHVKPKFKRKKKKKDADA